ncbi:serine hydrolase [Roseivirga sp. BDSF3-8]|uniref:serine hydrolase domain-containing protein n=1 Tax=Roseivirga sp. BDSF3-8 TaxID=3241598 RepID=UPI00353246E0
MKSYITPAGAVALLLLCLTPTRLAARSLPSGLEQKLDSILTQYQVPGAAIAFTGYDSLLHTYTFGKADIKEDREVSDSTLFCTGSITKTFLAAAMLLADEQGMLSLQDRLADELPEGLLKNEWREESPVRLIHLLEHTSGLDEAHFHLAARTNRQTPLSEVMQLSHHSLYTRWEPGSYSEYNTLGAIAAAHMLQEGTGMPLEAFMEAKVFSPMDMERATYDPTQSKAPHLLAKGYAIPPEEVPFPSLAQWPAGALSMTIKDMGRFMHMLMQRGHSDGRQILSARIIERMETPETSLAARKGIMTGYAKGLRATYQKGYLFYGHSGRYGGFLSDFAYSRKAGRGYVILINSSEAGGALKSIRQALLKDLNTPPRTAVSATEAPAADFSGVYRPVTGFPQLGSLSGFLVRLVDLQVVTMEGTQIALSGMLGDSQPLRWMGDSLFATFGSRRADIAFAQDDTGILLLTSETAYQQVPAWQAYGLFYGALIALTIMVISLLIWLVRAPYFLVRGRNMGSEWLPLLAILSLAGMVASFFTLYDPMKLYSPGAILFWLLGYSFLALSVAGLLTGLRQGIKRTGGFMVVLTSLACCFWAGYLWYDGIIGLALWAY